MNYRTILQRGHDLRCAGNTRAAYQEYRRLSQAVDAMWRIEAFNGMALCLKMEYKIKPALDYFNRALMLGDKERNPNRKIGIYRDIAITYGYRQDYQRAERYLVQAIDLCRRLRKSKDSFSKLGITEVKLGELFLHSRSLKDAESWLVQGNEHLARGDNRFWQLTGGWHLAELRYFQKKYVQALDIIQPLLFAAMGQRWMHRYVELLILRSACLRQMKKENESRHDHTLACYLAMQFDSPEVTDSTHKKWKSYLEAKR